MLTSALATRALPLDLQAKPPLAPVALSFGLAPTGCMRSSLTEVCQLLGIADIGLDSHAQFQRRRVKAGSWIFGSGEKCDSVFIVYSGFAKNLLIDEAGNEQVLSFPLRGDLIGMDGLYAGTYPTQAIALTECELIVIAYDDLMKLMHEHAVLETWFYRAMSRELSREHTVVALLGTMGAEARVARFLVLLSAHLEAQGFSPTHFNLPMTRQEIGSFLGLTLEAVSRAFSALHDATLIGINQRAVILKDIDALRVLRKLAPPAKLDANLYSIKSARNIRQTGVKQNNSIWSTLAISH